MRCPRPARSRRSGSALACERLEARQLLSATTTRDSGWFDRFTVTPAGANSGSIRLGPVEVDAAGNRYVMGSLSGAGSVDLDPGPGLAVQTFGGPGLSLNTLFLAKFDATGSLVWHRTWSTSNANWLVAGDVDLAVDRAGSVIVSGSFSGTIDFDPGAGVANLTSDGTGTNDLFVVKLTSAGDYQWAKHLGLRTPGGDAEEARLAVTDGGVVVAGTFMGRVDFDPGPGVDERTSRAGVVNGALASSKDVFLVELSAAAGQYGWCRTIGGPGDDRLADVAADASGNVFATGGFTDTVDFNPSDIGIFNLSATEYTADVFVLKLTSGGAFQFARTLPLGAVYSRDARIAVDPTGGLCVAGSITGLAPNPAGGSVGTYPLRLVKLDVVGADSWSADFIPARQPGWVGNNRNTYLSPKGLGFDSFGNVYVSGTLRGTVDLDPGPGVVSRSSDLPQENTANLLLKLSPAGSYVSDKTWFYGDDQDRTKGVQLAVDRAGNAVLAGSLPDPGGTVIAFLNQVHAPASLLVQNASGAWTALASGGAGFTQRQFAAWMPPRGLTNLTAADVDRDGDDDLVGLATDGSWWVGRNDGGTALVGVRFAAPFAGSQLTPLIGDVDGDGRADLVSRAANTGMWVLRRGTGSAFGNPELLGQWNAAVNWSNVALADVDGDGDHDIVARRPATGDWHVGLYARSPNSTIETRVFGNFVTTVNWTNVAVVDFDGDGLADIVGRNPATNAWWLARSTGAAFTNVRLGAFAAGVNWANVGFADVDGDYDVDILARNPTTGGWTVGRNDGGAAIALVAFGTWPAAGQWQLAAVGDYNGDGKADVVGFNAANGNLRVSLSTGAAFSDVIWGRLDPAVSRTAMRRVRL
ncbi:MAG: FG-GAP repeat domain-containing protein [Planctomycetota bacterium]